MKKLTYLLIACLSMISCRLEEEPKERIGPLNVVTTTGIIEDGLSNIVGSECEVTSLMGPGTDPHIYKPTPGDIEILDEADVIISNGLHLEGKMAEMLTKYGKQKPVIFMSDGIEEKEIIKSADFEDADDPHFWFDTKMWMQGLIYVTDELGKIEPESDSVFQKNLLAYEKELIKLDKWVTRQLNTLDKESRVLVTSHDAFSYFGHKYNIEVKGIQGISTLSEVGLKEIADMVDFVIERKIKAIFVETSTSNKTAQSIVDGCEAKGYRVELKGPLYSDALGEPDGDAGTYLGMVKANVNAIVAGLK